MQIADIPGARERVVMRGRARITHMYTIDDFGGVHATEVIWDPYLPSPAKQKVLARKISRVLCAKELEHCGLLEGGAA